jgi:hypothetical protein
MTKLPFFALTTLSVATALTVFTFAAKSLADTELNALYSDTSAIVRAPASDPFPEELLKDFVVSAPEREPASVVGHAKPAAHVPAKAAARRSRLPASIANGFELRVQYNKLTSMFWVVERDTHYDLVFANSAGSKASLGLSPDNFKTMHQLARGFTPLESNLAKCKDASMQMHVVANGSAERTVTMCVNTKSTEADRLRGLSQSLAAMVR